MMRREKQIILTARIMSIIFTPFYLPILGLMMLFLFSYLSIFPWAYKIEVLALVYLFTILMPTAMIHFYRRHQGWTLIELGHRERRMVPYVISILCYFVCVYIMERLHMPHFMGSIVVAALLVQMVCALINVWWKISTHTAAIGGRCRVHLCRILRIQPRMVAQPHHPGSGHRGQQPYDSATALAAAGGGRLLGGLRLCRSIHPLCVTNLSFLISHF